MAFMAPELLVPWKFGREDSVPTPEADIYAFGFVVLQVSRRAHRYRSFVYVIQVLTGETPFRGIRQSELIFSALNGRRPDKPEDASTIGFSDSLWDFTQRCWDVDMKLRPSIGEVVTRLGEAAANWNGLMSPHVRPGCVPYGDEDESLSSDIFGEFENTTPCRPCPSSNVTGGLFRSSPGESQTISGLFGCADTSSTRSTEPPIERLNGEVTRIGGIAFAGGTYCEIWQGWWEKPGNEGGYKEMGDGEKVRLNLTISILFTRLFVGVLENTSSAQVIREGASGSIVASHLCTSFSCLLRSLETRTRTINLGKATSSEHPAVVWCVHPQHSSPERFPWLCRDSYRYRTTPLHGERAVAREAA